MVLTSPPCAAPRVLELGPCALGEEPQGKKYLTTTYVTKSLFPSLFFFFFGCFRVQPPAHIQYSTMLSKGESRTETIKVHFGSKQSVNQQQVSLSISSFMLPAIG